MSGLTLSADGTTLSANRRTVRETPEGGLKIEGHDLGSSVSGFWGTDLASFDVASRAFRGTDTATRAIPPPSSPS